MSIFKNKIITKAFTMAEAILVMTILGIIATIMITTIKPAEFKQKAQKILKKKVFAEIDHAVTQILINDTKSGQLDRIFVDDASTPFAFYEDYSKVEQLFKKYLATTRKEYDSTVKMGSFSLTVSASSNSASQSPPFYLKNGATVFLGAEERYGYAPTIVVEGCEIDYSDSLGLIVVDINGEQEPNVAYQDQFYFPIGLNGIDYDQMCMEAPGDGTIYDCELAKSQMLDRAPCSGDVSQAYCSSLGDGWEYLDTDSDVSCAASLTPDEPVRVALIMITKVCRHSYCGYVVSGHDW